MVVSCTGRRINGGKILFHRQIFVGQVAVASNKRETSLKRLRIQRLKMAVRTLRYLVNVPPIINFSIFFPKLPHFIRTPIYYFYGN